MVLRRYCRQRYDERVIQLLTTVSRLMDRRQSVLCRTAMYRQTHIGGA
jgi:hypothetical protein